MNPNSSAIHNFYERLFQENMPKVPMFGVSVDVYMESQKKTIPFLNEPWLVRKCCHFLMEEGLQTEGLFRIPGSHTTVESIVQDFDQGKNPDFNSYPAFVEDIAGVLKKYLRDMPEPLLSEGNEDDFLQFQFLEAITSEIEDSKAQIEKLRNLVSQLPTYRRTIVCDMFKLFSKVIENQGYTLMGADNLATIFGGMTNIMTSLFNSTQRTQIVRILINNYKAIFEGVNHLSKRENDNSLDDQKDALKVYIHDGTFKSTFCQGTDTSRMITKKIVAKLQHTHDVTNYKMYEIRDSMIRKIMSDEKILAICKSGSGIIFTDKFKLEKKKKRMNKASETISSEKSRTSSPSITAVFKKKNHTHERTSSSESESEFSTWVFPEIPQGSVKASSWDLENSIEGIIIVTVAGDEARLIVRTENSVWDFNVDRLIPVEDSSRYYAIHGDDMHIGIGFETREGSLQFKDTTTEAYREAKGNEAPKTYPARVVVELKSSQIFGTRPLDYIQDGFYDPGIQEDGSVVDIDDLLAESIDKDKDIILINEAEDAILRKRREEATALVQHIRDAECKIKILALYVSSILGGVLQAEGKEGDLSVECLFKRNIEEVKNSTQSNVIPLGKYCYGLSRHRATMLKYLCDRLNPQIDSLLCRRNTLAFPDQPEFYWVLFPSDELGEYIYVDLTENVGNLILVSSSNFVQQFVEQIHGELPDQSANNDETCTE